MGYRQKQTSEPQSGLWLDSSLFPQKTQPRQTPVAPVRTNTDQSDTIIIAGTPVETKEKVTEFIERSKQEYTQSWKELVGLASKLKKKKEPEKAPDIQPFLSHSPPPPKPADQTPPAEPKTTQGQAVPISGQPVIPKMEMPSMVGVPSWKRFDRSRTIGTRQISPELISKFDKDEESDTGRIVSAIVEEQKPTVIAVISSLFFLITFVYTTLTLLSFGLILALAITLNNAGTPGFLYLKYYPNVGLLPIITCAATIVFMYVGYKIRDASRFGWFIGTVCLIVIPIAFSIFLPVMSYPLIRLVSIYAGTVKQSILPPVIDLTMLSRFFSLLLFFEGMLILLVASARQFRFPEQSLPQNARSSIIMMIFLFLVPITTVMSYGYMDSQDTDMGYSIAQNHVPYRLYTPELIPGNRTHSSRFTTDDELAGLFNAVRVTFDVPLPTLMKTGLGSQITMKQVQVREDFSLEAYLFEHTPPDAQTETVDLIQAKDSTGFLVRDRSGLSLWALFPENILIVASSHKATADELTEFVASLK